jgi:hypothetical protein
MTKEQWKTPLMVAFRRYADAHFRSSADEHNDGGNFIAMMKRADESDEREQEFLAMIEPLLSVSARCEDYRLTLEQIEVGCDKPSAIWDLANSALIRNGKSKP